MRHVVDAYNESGNPGQFRVVQTTWMLHVLPFASKNAAGVVIERASVLETPITITAGRRSAASFLKDVVAAVEATARVRIAVMGAPTNLFATAAVDPTVTRGLALNIMARGLHEIGDGKLSWRLMYSPDSRGYMLTIHQVRGAKAGI